MPPHPDDRYLSTPIATMNVLCEGPAFDLLIRKLEAAIESAVTKAMRARDELSKPAVREQPPLSPPQRKALADLEQSKGRLVRIAEVAKMLGVSQRHLWSMYSSGQMPAPVYLGRSVRWVAAELEDWIRVGCPPTERREASRKQ